MSRMEQTRTDRIKTAILRIAATGLLAGLALYVAGKPRPATSGQADIAQGATP